MLESVCCHPCRHAYNIQIQEVNTLLTKAIFSQPLHTGHTQKKAYMDKIKKVGHICGRTGSLCHWLVLEHTYTHTHHMCTYYVLTYTSCIHTCMVGGVFYMSLLPRTSYTLTFARTQMRDTHTCTHNTHTQHTHTHIHTHMHKHTYNKHT